MAVTAAANALATVANVKYVAGIAQTDTTKDDRIQTLINLLSGRIEDWCGRKFISQTFTDQVYDGQRDCDLFLKQYPIVSITAVSVDGVALTAGELADEENFLAYAEEGYIWRSSGWFAKRRGIEITYVAGYATIPTGLQMACVEWAIILLEGRMKDAQVDGGGMKTAMPDQIMNGLQPYKRLD